MITLHRGEERGHGDYGTIRSRHSFSFGHYHDPARMGLSHLRVLNDDWVAPGAGFPAHGHRDMEIISYVTAGHMEHQDSLGNRFRIGPGEFQSMSAGSGIRHSEYNASAEDPLTFLQIWIEPREHGLPPSYAPPCAPSPRRGEWLEVAGPGATASLTLRQDARLWLARLERGEGLETPIAADRQGYLHLVRGEVECEGEILEAGDALSADQRLTLTARSDAEVLWFDLPR